MQPLDLALLLVFGLLGLMMRRFGLPVLPLIIGVILGPRIERQLRQTLQLGGGDWSSLFTEPVAIVTYILITLLLAVPAIVQFIRYRRPEATVQEMIEKETRGRAAQSEKEHA